MCLVSAYMLWGLVAEFTAFWSRLYENEWECDSPALPPNRSGVKVLVAGFGKTGTRTMSRTLFQLGFNHSYHGEDFGLFIWGRYADKYWLRKHGGRWSQVPYPGGFHNFNTNDAEVVANTSSEEFAAAISRCRVDAVAFDGIEKLFFPIYRISPGVKVIMLNWRTFEEWRRSLEAWAVHIAFEILIMLVINTPFCVLPWSALYKVLDPLEGFPREQIMRAGGPPICQVYDSTIALVHGALQFRRIVSTWFSGNNFYPHTKELYDGYFEEVKALVPPEDLFAWDMKKHTYEDLCGFLGIADCPKSGSMPRATDKYLFAREHPAAFTRIVLVSLFVNWVNWKIFKRVFSLLLRIFVRRPKSE